ncbi:MAG: citrate lyase subunit beta [Methyloligella sp.]|nr:MAG: citrate lyase subunit beta [Methyloligella sp.]
MVTIRPRRSVLYMPGSKERALEKGKSLPTDAIIFDLEDAVAPDMKDMARDQVASAVQAGGYGQRELIIRVNGLDTPWFKEDLKAAASAKPNAILVPKVSSGEDIRSVRDQLKALGADPSIDLWAMMETPLAMLKALDIAENGPSESHRLAVFIMGTNDLSKETGAAIKPGREAMLAWLSTCVAAGRAFGIDIVDGVYNDFKDENGFKAECAQGNDLGMDGKTLIHPGQIGPCNEIFSPSAEAVEWAKKIIEAFELPENQGKGAITVDGKMVELLHAEMAKRTVAISEAIEALAQS